MIEHGVLYKAYINRIEENRCYVSLEDYPYDEGWARLMFPFYSIVRFDGSGIRYGHGIVFKPELNSECIVMKWGDEMVIIGFLPPLNEEETLTDQSTVEGVENIDTSYKSASELIQEYKNMKEVNDEQDVPRKESYYHNDDQKTFGDMGMTASSRNKIFCFSFGLNLIQASEYCFRFYSKLKHTIKEAFWNYFSYTPNGTIEWTNSRENGSNYIRKMKNNYGDTQPILTEIIGEQAQGHMIRHDSHEDETEASVTDTIDLEANQSTVHSAGETLCVERRGQVSDGRSITAKNHDIKGTFSMNVSSVLKTQLSGTLSIISNGVLNTVQGVFTTVKGKALVHINPAQSKKTKDSPATGNTKNMAGKMKTAEALGKVQEYAPQAQKTATQVRAGKVKEAMTGAAMVYGPKVIDKVGGTAPDASKVKTSALSKVNAAVDKAVSKFPEGMRDKIKEAAVKQINKYSSQQFGNLVSNSISTATGAVISDQPDEDVMGVVASSDPETYDKDNIEFKHDDMDEMMEQEIGPATKDIVKDSTTTPSPDDPSVSVMENGIADVITDNTVRDLVPNEQTINGWAVDGSRGMA